MSQTLQAVRGMNDILPDEAAFWELFEDTIRSWLKAYGYRPIRLPIVEPTPLFKRKGLERFQIEIKAFDRVAAVERVREAVELVSASTAGKSVKFAVDVDPQ